MAQGMNKSKQHYTLKAYINEAAATDRNFTCPSMSSASTQPPDQMSIAVVYSVAPNMSSGAL